VLYGGNATGAPYENSTMSQKFKRKGTKVQRRQEIIKTLRLRGFAFNLFWFRPTRPG
jgi:hypothetical protein